MADDRGIAIDDLILELDGNETNIRFARLVLICETVFGKGRSSGSHHIFKTPWVGDPRINVQRIGKKAKPYQVKQVVIALRKLQSMKN
jgi:hypothetical protein